MTEFHGHTVYIIVTYTHTKKKKKILRIYVLYVIIC